MKRERFGTEWEIKQGGPPGCNAPTSHDKSVFYANKYTTIRWLLKLYTNENLKSGQTVFQ